MIGLAVLFILALIAAACAFTPPDVKPEPTASGDMSDKDTPMPSEDVETVVPDPTPDVTETELLTPEITGKVTSTPDVTATEAPTDTVSETPFETPTDTPTASPSTPTPTPVPEKEDNETRSGVKYTVSGGTNNGGGVYSINQGFKISFEDNAFKQSFNRFVFNYTSSAPLKITVSYKSSGKTVTDSFFLDKGENMVFRGLVSSYLNSGKGAGIGYVEVSTCEKKNATFRLMDLTTENIAVYNSTTYYLENSRYKLGIKLSWGGGINYIEDKTASVSGITNLINQADTGRLIQQSYYGTAGNSEYTPGDFNGSRWTYNPVQGGDKYGNASRLIDVEITSNSVYIKAQPQDWSLNGQITPSYMENTYTLNGDVIRVDNRFTDYSGWTHRYSSQELPAFYTISYLDTFTFYNGIDSWNDGKLAVKPDLNFWGDPAYSASCTFPVKVDNTETWCAWYNRSADYGIGLYVPNIDCLYAGRFSYNGSKDPYNGATNYVAPLNTICIVSFTPIEYSYLITTGNVSTIRSTFKANRNFATNDSLHRNYQSSRVPYFGLEELNFSDSKYMAAIGHPYNTAVSYNDSKKALELKVSNAFDPSVMILYANAPEPMYANDYGTLTIEYMIPVTNSMKSYECDLFICTGSVTEPSGDARHRVTLVCDGSYHTVTVNLKSLSFWNGEIHKIRFDYFDQCGNNDVIYVKSINLN